MADLGQLDDFLSGADITFTFKGKQYEVTPTARQVLEFQRDYQNDINSDKPTEEISTWARVCPLLGSTLNKKTLEIEGGILGELIDDGATYTQLERIVSAVHFKYVQGDDLAKAYFETGNLGKSLKMAREANQNND